MPPRRLTYRGIADDLQDRIHAGQYPPGSKLPTYREIAELYEVSQATAYRAVSLLADRGAVEGESGRGVFVVDDED
jgi:DNA-binding GntR family transcriptional regulator